MENSVQIETIRQRIKTESPKSICVLYNLIFEDEGDRRNRSKLREFSGFEFQADSDEFRAKMKYAGRFSIGDLISMQTMTLTTS